MLRAICLPMLSISTSARFRSLMVFALHCKVDEAEPIVNRDCMACEPKPQVHSARSPRSWNSEENRLAPFRHAYSTLLRSVGTEFKVMQELLRHSSLRSTLDVYTQAITPAKHAAQAAVMSLVLGAGNAASS